MYIIYIFRTIILIFVAMFITTFQPLYAPAFFKWLECGQVEKSGVADHIWREKEDHYPLWDQVEIIDKEHHWKTCKLKESAHMLVHKNLQSRPSIEINTIWEPVIRSAREKQ